MVIEISLVVVLMFIDKVDEIIRGLKFCVFGTFTAL